MVRHRGSKKCSVCKEIKSLDLFSLDRRAKDSKSSKCRECNYKIVKTWRKNNPQKQNKLNSLYKKRHPVETMIQARKDATKYYYKSCQKSRIKYRYGISFEEFESLKLKQRNKCAICKKKEYEKELNIDHDHQTGKVRGLLCTKCNTGLGLLCDNPTIIMEALKYLHESKKND